MEKRIFAAVVFAFGLVLIQFAYFPTLESEMPYQRYKEEFSANLRNPLTERYRNLSFEKTKEQKREETK